MTRKANRREFLGRTALIGTGIGLGSLAEPPKTEAAATRAAKAPLYKISLAQWSLHRTHRSKKLDNLDFAKTANSLGIDAVEYVNQFFKDKAKDKKYLAEMKKRAAGEGVYSVLIMIDGEGALGDSKEAGRSGAIEKHKRWVEAAAYLGCHSIRVNASSRGSYDEQVKLAADQGIHMFVAKPVSLDLAQALNFADAIEHAGVEYGLPTLFIGIILIPIFGNAAEHFTAITVARKNKMDLSVGIAVGSSIQIALFVAPAMVLLGWGLGVPLTLEFGIFETVATFLAVLVTNFIIQDGESNWLEGAMLLVTYAILALAFFFL